MATTADAGPRPAQQLRDLDLGQPGRDSAGQHAIPDRRGAHQGYRDLPAGNEDVEQADPFFSFRATDYARTGATQGDMVVMGDTHYSIVADPEMDGGDWCRVAVRVYA